MRRLYHSQLRDHSCKLGSGSSRTNAAIHAQPPRSQSQAPVAACVFGADEPTGSYEYGASLGCPDCATGEIHCCPFFWADGLDEPQRSQVLRHMRGALQDVIAEKTGRVVAVSESISAEDQPCQCHNSWAAITPIHRGHCCFLPAIQTCHPQEVAAWESRRGRMLQPRLLSDESAVNHG